jgi:SAM-dependent methyltransferase
MERTRFEAEFGQYAAWIVDAIQQIGFRDPVPAACRGTGNPSLLEHLAADLTIDEGSLVLDVGVGLGGPGAWLVRERSCTLVGIDLMIEAAQGATRLFPDIHATVGSTRTLPFRDMSFDAAWALGVVEMIADKGRSFREIARVLVPGGRVVLYDFVAAGSILEATPAASRFETAEAITRKLERSGLDVLRAQAVPSISPPPDEWRAALIAVRDRIQDDHSGDRRLIIAEEERRTFNRLRRCGHIQEWEFLAERARG